MSTEAINESAGAAPYQSASWEDVLAMTQEMLHAAKSELWERVGELEAARHPLLHAVMDRPVTAADARTVADNIHSVVDADNEIQQLVRERLSGLQTQLTGMRKTRRASLAYARGSV